MTTVSSARPVAVPPGERDALLALLARLEAVEAAHQALTTENRRLALRVQDLEAQLRARKGASAPPPAPGTLSLFGEAGEAMAPANAPPAPTSRRRPERGARLHGPQPLDPGLPREVIVLPDPPEAERVCPQTGALMGPGFTEELEVLARRPAVFFVKRYVRQVFVSLAKTAPVATSWPADVLPRSRMHASVVAHIAAAHFSAHLPYYRLEQQLARTGVALARSTQVSLMAQLDTLVAPLVAHLKAQVLASGYVHLDATPIDVCDPARPGAARSATLWAYRARSPDPLIEGLVWFDYQATKSPVHPAAVLRAGPYRGVVQTDGASGLDALGPPDRITHLGCWAHARRYLVAAVDSGDSRATSYLAQVDRLFRLDARARRALAVPRPVEQRAAVAARVAAWRTRFSIPLAEAVFTRAMTEILAPPPKSALAVALGYLLGQRPSLVRCVTTPGAYLDNNGRRTRFGR